MRHAASYLFILGGFAGLMILFALPPEPGWIGGTSVLVGAGIGGVAGILIELRR